MTATKQSALLLRGKILAIVLACALALALIAPICAPAPDSAAYAADAGTRVTLTYQDGERGFAFARQPLDVYPGLASAYGYTYGPGVGSLDITALDAIVAAHVLMYGSDVAKVTANLALSEYGYIGSAFGSPNAWAILTSINGSQPHGDAMIDNTSYLGYPVNGTVIKSGDNVEFYTIQDMVSWGDYYTWFEKDGVKTEKLRAVAGSGKIELTLKGYTNMYALSTELGAHTAPVENAALTRVLVDESAGWRVGNFADYGGGLYKSDASGKLLLEVPSKGGTYYYSAFNSGGAYPLFSPWLELTVVDKPLVSFDANGGKLSGAASKSVVAEEPYGELPSATRKGYSFEGWYTAKSGGEKVSETTTVSLTSDHTLYARWSANKYKVKFNASGGKGAGGSKNVVFGKKYGKLPTPKKDLKDFAGWYTQKSGGKKVTANTKLATAKNHTLYAHWRAAKAKVTNCNYLSVRQSYRADAKVVAIVKKGSALTVTAKHKGWYKVKIGKQSGWAYAKYLSL
ncbi:MAG: InlB B-repeat-containing protein [Clostridiales Family XIII bacterium]|jgi:uncharacterized repeat protein (TIGR02543 family)|nr:InlB B-repeat-containing protein [Clostridiales Family XIII bacterium]